MRSFFSQNTKVFLGNFLIFLAFVLLQYSLGVRPSFLFSPNLLLLFFVFYNLSFPWLYNLFLAFLLGLISDTLSGIIWGEYLISFVIIWLIGIVAIQTIKREHLFSKLIVGKIQIFIFYLSLFIYHLLFHQLKPFLHYFLLYIINACIFGLFMFLLLNLKRKTK